MKICLEALIRATSSNWTHTFGFLLNGPWQRLLAPAALVETSVTSFALAVNVKGFIRDVESQHSLLLSSYRRRSLKNVPLKGRAGLPVSLQPSCSK